MDLSSFKLRLANRVCLVFLITSNTVTLDEIKLYAEIQSTQWIQLNSNVLDILHCRIIKL